MQKKIRAAFLDRDGVINIDSGYVSRPEDFAFVPGAAEACAALAKAGFTLFIVTNQSGIGRGYFTEDDFRHLMTGVTSQMKAAGAPVEHVYFCPHHPEAKIPEYRSVCSCRKPAPGMILQAAADYPVDLAASVLFGDSTRDIEAGHAAGVGTLVLLGKDGREPPKESPFASERFASLADAVKSPWFFSFQRKNL